jgi:GNAT superfamily N-acetyltransferase
VPGPSFELRDARPSDLPGLEHALRDHLYWEPGTPQPPLERLAQEEDFQRWLADWGRPGDSAVVGEVAGALAGAGFYRLFRPRERIDGFFDARVPVLVLSVRSDCRGLGHGQRILDGLIDRALESGAPGLSTSVSAANPALQWLERRGFIQVAEVRGAWTMMLDAPLARVKRRSQLPRL